MRISIKRFALFAHHVYYPSGGWDDLVDTFDTDALAISAGMEKLQEKESYYEAHVADLQTGDTIWREGTDD